MFRFFRSPDWRSVDYWALDLETSGFDPRSDDILSVGMVPIRGGTIRWGERHYSLVRPRRGHRAAEEAMRVHHILPDEVRDAPRLCQVLEEIESRLGEAHLLVHYGKLDVGFLKIAYRRHFRIWRRTGIIDTVRLLGRLTHLRRQLDPYADSLPADLARARAELGLPRHIHHHALYDALATAELFLALTGRLGVRRLRQLR